MYQVILTYEDAQKLIPVFQHYKSRGPWKAVRSDASVILRELGNVRDIDYAPLRGKQVVLSDEQYQFFQDVASEML